MPAGADDLSRELRQAIAAGARVAPRGAGTWWPDPAEGARPLEAGALDGLLRLDAGDLVATAQAGCRLDRLADALDERGVWLALDPPGPLHRSLGGALGCGGAGPLAARFGPPRDQVLGLTVLAGNGAVVRTGGRVVKNVAGFDLAKAVVGAHGGLGVIVEAHLRVRAKPQADRTAAWAGSPEHVAGLCRDLIAAGATPAAFEALSPSLSRALGLPDAWALCLRALGTAGGVDEELALAGAVAPSLGCEPVRSRQDLWEELRRAVGSWPIVLRLGAELPGWTEAVALAERYAGPLLGASVTVPRGSVRVGCGELSPAALAGLRAAARRRRWPVTLERAPAALRQAAGVWGALDPGADRLARALRAAFDPNGVFAVPLLS